MPPEHVENGLEILQCLELPHWSRRYFGYPAETEIPYGYAIGSGIWMDRITLAVCRVDFLPWPWAGSGLELNDPGCFLNVPISHSPPGGCMTI